MTEDKLGKYLSSRSSVYLSRMDDMAGEKPADEYDECEDEEIPVHVIEPGSEEEREAVKEGKMTVKGFYLSFSILSLLILLIGLLLSGNKLSFIIGVLTGFATGVFYIWHLNSSIKDVLNCDEDTAGKTMRRDSTIRMGVLAIAGIVVSAVVGGDSIIGVLAQMMSLKLSVYLTPFAVTTLMKSDSRKK